MSVPNADVAPTATSPVLRLDDVVITYGRRNRAEVRAVRGASLEVKASEIVGLVGESGCGKSSLGRAAVGLEKLSAGSVTFNGRPVVALGRHRRPPELRPLQMLFQDPYSSLNPRRKVGHQLADGIRAANEEATGARIADLLTMVAMPASAADHFPHEFSGGQRQRLAIGRALAARPSILVADEPVSSLDASAQAAIVSLLAELREHADLGILLISHDLAVVRQVAQRVAVMYLGEIVETGPIGPVWQDPRHPYTESLVAAAPKADGEGRIPKSLGGEVPDPSEPPPGCSFHPRCPIAVSECRAVNPASVDLGGGHLARCLFARHENHMENDPTGHGQGIPVTLHPSSRQFVKEANP